MVLIAVDVTITVVTCTIVVVLLNNNIMFLHLDLLLFLLLTTQSPMQFEDHSILYILNETDAGDRPLEEAVRIGDRIAIMRDGKMVQIGTAEDIVMEPADDYVADFVAGISRLKVVHAHAVMQPIEEFVSKNGRVPADTPRVDTDETLSALINLAIDDESPIVVRADSKDVGVITRADLLRTVIEGTEVS